MKHPRSMKEAFGPYTSNDLQGMEEEEPPYRGTDLVIAALFVVVCWCLTCGCFG